MCVLPQNATHMLWSSGSAALLVRETVTKIIMHIQKELKDVFDITERLTLRQTLPAPPSCLRRCTRVQ